MDQILQYDTGTQSIEGYTCVPYAIYGLQCSTTPLPRRAPLHADQLIACLDAARSIIHRGDLALPNSQLRVVWVFGKPLPARPDASVDKSTYTPAPPSPGPYKLIAISNGLLCAAELLKKRPVQATAQQQQSQSGATGAAASPATSERPQLETPRVYAAFLSAVLWTVTYVLARDHGIAPLNFRTLLVRAPRIEDGDAAGAGSSLRAVALDANLTNTGTLAVSYKVLADGAWRAVGDPAVASSYAGRVRIGPMGVEGWYHPVRSRVADEDDEGGKWREMVKRWLGCNGIELEALDDPKSWVRVSRSNRTEAQKAVRWPAQLCYAPGSRRSASAVDRFGVKDPAFQDETIEDGTPLVFHGIFGRQGLSEVLNEAEKWAAQKDARDAALKARQSAKIMEDAGAQDDADASMLDASSPFNTRQGMMFDPSGATGIYPTPPDGIPGQPPPISMNDSSTHASDSLGYQPLTESLARPGETPLTVAGPGRENLATSATDSNFEPFGNDDDEFCGNNDLTEADFSFFDEPDDDVAAGTAEPVADAIDMPDVPAQADADGNKANEPEPVAETSVDPMQDVRGSEDVGVNEVTSLSLEDEKPPILAIETEDHSGEPESKEDKMLLLSPELVRRRLFPHEVDGTSASLMSPLSAKRDNPFEAIVFSQDFLSSDSKYGGSGRFSFFGTLPHLTAPPSPFALAHTGPTFHKLPFPLELQALREREARAESPDTTDESHDAESLSSDAEERPAKATQPLFFGSRSVDAPRGTKRKFLAVEGEKEASAAGATEKPTARKGPAIVEEMAEIPEYFIAESNSRPLVATTEPDALDSSSLYDETSPTQEDAIAIAQIIASQHMFSSLRTAHVPSVVRSPERDQNRTFLKALRHSVHAVFPGSQPCDIARYLQIQDVFPGIGCLANMKNYVKKAPGAPPQISAAPIDPSTLVFPIPAPQIQMRRLDSLWDLLPTALSFWEELGLAPPGGPKHLRAYCLYPSSASKPDADPVADSASDFLESIGSGYETLKLGTHTKAKLAPFERAGLIPYAYGAGAPEGQVLTDLCANLGSTFARAATETPIQPERGGTGASDSTQPHNYVVYVVDPFGTTTSLRQICAAFWNLFQHYRKSPFVRTMPQLSDIVLQVVPLDVISRLTVSAVADAELRYRLAREVYDRCPPSRGLKQNLGLSIYAAPSIQLEERLPRTIHFKVDKESPLSLLHDNAQLHVGYSKSFDGNWMTAVWTDNTGKFHTTASYCLYKYRTMAEVVREIWETTMDFLPARRATWRLCVARVGVMEQDEVEAWRSFIFLPSHLQILVTLATVDPAPYLSITPPETQAANSQPTAVGTAGTPVSISTPQAGPSPDAHAPTPAATPNDLTLEAIADPDAHLLDSRDETYGILLNRRFRNAHSITDCRPCLASGLLVKRGCAPGSSDDLFGTDDDEGTGEFRCLAVNVVWIWQVGQEGAARNTAGGLAPGLAEGKAGALPMPLAYVESTLRDLLVLYRGMGLLGRLRGLRGTHHGLVPWHVAVAVRGAEKVARAFPS